MKEPIHEFKRFVHYANNYKPPYWSFDGRPCWLGSGIKDINGREIFEGDIVKLKDGKTYPVVFEEGMLMIDNIPLKLFAGEVEIIGHIAEEDNQ